ncbi:hypothetical protein L1887_30791 [Cichorium endivia]|nr:hypothetical protein L1887_30791 [Cichorium endivia]
MELVSLMNQFDELVFVLLGLSRTVALNGFLDLICSFELAGTSIHSICKIHLHFTVWKTSIMGWLQSTVTDFIGSTA